jgi:hypothetical protein
LTGPPADRTGDHHAAHENQAGIDSSKQCVLLRSAFVRVKCADDRLVEQEVGRRDHLLLCVECLLPHGVSIEPAEL